MTDHKTEKEAKPSAILGDWFVSTPESEAMLAEEVAALRKTEKAQAPDCKCSTPDHSGRGTCQRCDGFACEYADRGQTRCPSWRCDCFIETHPFDNPQGLHPEAFVVGPVIPTAEEQACSASWGSARCDLRHDHGGLHLDSLLGTRWPRLYPPGGPDA